MMDVSRLGFIKGIAASLGVGALGGGRVFAAPPGWKPPKGAKLVFGALSDTHLRTDYTGLKAARTFPHKYLISALEYFRSQNVDAVVHCGDAAHRGQIRELEFHAEAWNKVFPNGCAPDGHRIEKLFVTGNHEIDGWQYGNDVGFKVERVFKDPEERARRILATDIASSWKRVWGETYEPVWHKEVKGYHFFGRNHNVPKEELVSCLRRNAAVFPEIKAKGRPCFYMQHTRPLWDVRKLLRHLCRGCVPVSFFGHNHWSASSWNIIALYRGNVPCIQVPSCEPRGCGGLVGDAWITPAKIEKTPQTCKGRQGYVVRVYDDMLVISRREFGAGGSLGEDWVMPFGAVSPHPFSKVGLKKAAGEPQFRAGAKLSVKLEVVNVASVKMLPIANIQSQLETDNIGIDNTGNAGNIVVNIPLANGNPKCRVYAYEVEIRPADSALATYSPSVMKAVYAAGVNLGMGHEPNEGVTTLEIGRSELPKGGKFVVSVTPLTSIGTRGRPITANVF
ncbi:MAG: metallophosphoesterase [Kiritimatiellae bacterium]|nr:metallophosphoesterase [Kiritimatiellia bacterium]